MDFNEEYATLPEQLEFKTEYKTFLNELQDLVKKFYNNKCHDWDDNVVKQSPFINNGYINLFGILYKDGVYTLAPKQYILNQIKAYQTNHDENLKLPENSYLLNCKPKDFIKDFDENNTIIFGYAGSHAIPDFSGRIQGSDLTLSDNRIRERKTFNYPGCKELFKFLKKQKIARSKQYIEEHIKYTIDENVYFSLLDLKYISLDYKKGYIKENGKRKKNNFTIYSIYRIR